MLQVSEVRGRVIRVRVVRLGLESAASNDFFKL